MWSVRSPRAPPSARWLSSRDAPQRAPSGPSGSSRCSCSPSRLRGGRRTQPPDLPQSRSDPLGATRADEPPHLPGGSRQDRPDRKRRRPGRCWRGRSPRASRGTRAARPWRSSPATTRARDRGAYARGSSVRPGGRRRAPRRGRRRRARSALRADSRPVQPLRSRHPARDDRHGLGCRARETRRDRRRGGDDAGRGRDPDTSRLGRSAASCAHEAACTTCPGSAPPTRRCSGAGRSTSPHRPAAPSGAWRVS